MLTLLEVPKSAPEKRSADLRFQLRHAQSNLSDQSSLLCSFVLLR